MLNKLTSVIFLNLIWLRISTKPILALPITNPVLPPDLGQGEGEVIISRLLARFFSASLAIGTISFLIYLVYGAFRWLTAGDDKTQLQSARGTMTQALIGLTILASLFAIARIIGILLGLTCDGQSFPDVICWPTIDTSGLGGVGLPPAIPTGGGPF